MLRADTKAPWPVLKCGGIATPRRMSQVLINQYLADLSRLKKVSGEAREGIVSEAFKDLLRGWDYQHDLVFDDQITREFKRFLGAVW